MVTIGSGAERAIDDIVLTRYACYLIAQNGDPLVSIFKTTPAFDPYLESAESNPKRSRQRRISKSWSAGSNLLKRK